MELTFVIAVKDIWQL